MAELNKNDLFSEDLIRAPYELAKGLGLVVDQIDKITAASKNSETVLKSSNSASKIAKETQSLTAQEKELLKVQNQISVALAKNNDEYIEHKRGLDAINRAVKEKINKGREDLTFTGQMKNAMKDLKTELKEARNAMLAAADAGGTMSKEYQEAAKKAGEIGDKIGDAKDEAKVFANDTAFGALGTRVGLLKDKVMSLDFKGVGEQLKGIGKIIMANPLLLLAGIITGIVVGLVALKDSIPFVGAAFDKISQGIDYVVGKLKAFSDWLGISTFAANDKANALVEASRKEIEAIEGRYEKEIAMATAAGKTTIDLEIAKQKAIRDTAYAQVRMLLGLGKLNEEQQKQLDEFVKITSKAVNDLDILEEKKHQDFLKRQEEKQNALRKEIMNRETLRIAGEMEIEAQRAKDQKEIEALAKKLSDKNDLEQEYLTIAGQMQAEHTDYLESLSVRRIDQGIKEIERQEAFINELSAVLVGAAFANNENLKALAKNFSTFILNQIERQLIATQAAVIFKANAELLAGAAASSLFDPTALLRAIGRATLITGLIKAAFGVAKASIARFATGTDSAPGGLAYVGEKGKELIITPSGQVSLSPNRATLTNLPKGSTVIPNDETMRILASNSLRGVSTTRSGDFILYGKLSQLESAIRETNEKVVGAVDRSNGRIFNHGSLIYEMKRKSDGSAKMIRLKSLSR